MSYKDKVYLLAMMAMMAGDKSMYALPRTTRIESESKKDLPCWNVDGHTIYAKDEKTALKYARKRGLLREGVIVKEDNK